MIHLTLLLHSQKSMSQLSPKAGLKNRDKKWLGDMTAALVSLCRVAPLTPRSFPALVAAPHTDTPIGRSLILLRARSEHKQRRVSARFRTGDLSRVRRT